MFDNKIDYQIKADYPERDCVIPGEGSILDQLRVIRLSICKVKPGKGDLGQGSRILHGHPKEGEKEQRVCSPLLLDQCIKPG